MTARVGMAMIVRDEAARIEACLDTWWGHVDVAAIVDTGSTDDTLDVIRAYADQHPGTELLTGTFAWCDDFAAARNAAEALLDQTDVHWRCWVDADDRIRGAEHLRHLAAQAPPNVTGLVFGYNYAQDDEGRTTCYLRRERLVRTGEVAWAGRVHESRALRGDARFVDEALVEWVHAKGAAPAEHEASADRNLTILQGWLEEEPDNHRVLNYLATEALSRGENQDAVDLFRRYLALDPGWDDERAQVHRRLAMALMRLEDWDAAERVTLDALAVAPAWPDSYLTLAQLAYRKGAYLKAAHWARQTVEMGTPHTLLIVNPYDYTVAPGAVLAGSLQATGRLDEAIAAARTALEHGPHDELSGALQTWLAGRARDELAGDYVRLAMLLVGGDEQLKALALLDSVPASAQDHPAVVRCRSMLRQRLLHVLDPGRAPAEPQPEQGGDPVDMRRLPRANFLARNLCEQAQVPVPEAVGA